MTLVDANTGGERVRTALLAELLACIEQDVLSFCGDEEHLRDALAAVDFDDPASVLRAGEMVSRWRMGGDA